MSNSQPDSVKVRDLLLSMLPIVLYSAAAMTVFLIRQVYGPSEAERTIGFVALSIPITGSVMSFWSPWRERLQIVKRLMSRKAHPAEGPSATWYVQLIPSIAGLTVILGMAYGVPWIGIHYIADIASPFETMKWLLTLSIIIQGLAWRAVLSRRRISALVGVSYWLVCAGVGVGLWRMVTGLFA